MKTEHRRKRVSHHTTARAKLIFNKFSISSFSFRWIATCICLHTVWLRVCVRARERESECGCDYGIIWIFHALCICSSWIDIIMGVCLIYVFVCAGTCVCVCVRVENFQSSWKVNFENWFVCWWCVEIENRLAHKLVVCAAFSGRQFID